MLTKEARAKNEAAWRDGNRHLVKCCRCGTRMSLHAPWRDKKVKCWQCITADRPGTGVAGVTDYEAEEAAVKAAMLGTDAPS